MRARSARFSRSASTNSVGSAKHRVNILVSLRLLPPPFGHPCLGLFPECRSLTRNSDDNVDPYHTYLSIAAAAIITPDPAWGLQPLDPLFNATHETTRWAKEHVSAAAPPEPKR